MRNCHPILSTWVFWFLLGCLTALGLFAGASYYNDQQEIGRALNPPKRVWQI